MLPLIEENVFSFIVHCPVTGTPYKAGKKAGLSEKSVDFINSALSRVVVADKQKSKTNGLIIKNAKKEPVLAANLAVSYLANTIDVSTRGSIFGAWGVSQHLTSYSEYVWGSKVERDLKLLKETIYCTEQTILAALDSREITEEQLESSKWLHEAIFTRLRPGPLTGTDLASLYTAKSFIPTSPTKLNEGQIHRICDNLSMPTKAPTRVATAEYQKKIDKLCEPYNTPGGFKPIWQVLRSAGKESIFWEAMETMHTQPGKWREKCSVGINTTKF